MEKRNRLKLCLLLLADAIWICFILTRSIKSAEASSAESGSVLELLRRLLPGLTMHAVRKLAHFTEFFILGGLLTLTARPARLPALLAVPAGLAVAVCDELVQLWAPGRSAQLTDVLLDLSGVVCGCLLLCLLLRLTAGRRPGGKKGE